MPSSASHLVGRALAELASGVPVGDVTAELANGVDAAASFDVGIVLLEVAADALDLAAPSRAEAIEYEGLRERYLPERPFSGKTEHHKSHFALRAAIAIRAGFRPDVEREVSWWQNQDLWLWAWFAAVIAVRLAAERTGRSVADVIGSISADDRA